MMTRIIGAAILIFTVSLHFATISAQSQGAPQSPRGGQRATPAKTQPPLTLRQVIETLSAPRGPTRAEDLVSKRGVQFQANPAILDILKEFGASPKLLAMIPVPPPPPAPPAPKVAGPLTVICEPKDCAVVVNDMYKGPTSQNRKTIDGLPAGAATIEVRADGFDTLTRPIQLQIGQPLEEKFSLKRSDLTRQQSASRSFLKAVSSLGGIDGLAELGDIEGSGVMNWTDSDGQTQKWPMTFNKRIGKDLAMTFKTRDGQCSASIVAQSAKQECKGELKNGGETIADQGSSLFLTYQPQDVMQTLLKKTLLASESDENRLESSDGVYALTLGNDGLPATLVYRVDATSAPIEVHYSNYLNLNNSRYPGQIAMGRLNSAPVWVFTISSVRRSARGR